MFHPDCGLARVLSLLIAIGVSVWVLVWPQLMLTDEGHINHAWMMLLVWSIAAGLVHGVGIVPRNQLARVLLGPLVSWGLPVLVLVAIR